MFPKYLIPVFCAGLLALPGCKKKKEQAAMETAPKLEIETSAAKESSDDIFDEFYEDSQTKSKPNKPVKPQAGRQSSAPEFNPDGRYAVQVSCVLSSALAQNIVAKLESKGYPAYIADVENPTPDLIGTYRRVRVGGFSGVSQAKAFGENYLTQDGYEYWVDNRSNDNVGMGGAGLGAGAGSGYSTYGSETAAPPPPAQTPSQSWGEPEAPAPAPPSKAAPAAAPAPETKPAAAPAAEPKKAESKDNWGSEDEWGKDSSSW